MTNKESDGRRPRRPPTPEIPTARVTLLTMFSSVGAKIRVVVALLLTALLALTLSSCSSDGETSGAAPQDLCSPPGVGAATAAPTNLAAAGAAAEDRYTTPSTTPIDQIDASKLNLITPGVLTVGTLSDAPPSICVNSENQFTGYDNELL